MRVMRWAVAALLTGCGLALGDVKLPAILSDNMLLQANRPVRIWGMADAGEKVTVSFGQQSVSAAANDAGNWQVMLKPLTPGETGKLVVAGKNTIAINNVLAGSVWICSGQSNMEFGMKTAHNAASEIPKANYPKIRLFLVSKTTAVRPQADVVGKWVECTPQSLVVGGKDGFSAVAYFFGRDLHVATDVPVGLIETSWGGTPAQAWTSLPGLQDTPELKHYVDTPLFGNAAQAMEETKAEQAKAIAAWEKKRQRWEEEVGVPYQAALKAWAEEARVAKEQGKTAPPQPLPSREAPRKPLAGEVEPHVPTSLYNAMIAPLTPFTIEGVIWYQGENNAPAAVEYRTLFPRMIRDWREKWGQGDFPFLFVQLANFMEQRSEPSDHAWAWLREAQAMTLKLPNTGMAVAIDIGDAVSIHPTNKMDVGHRLALHALKMVFARDLVASGPLYDSMKIEGDRIRVRFKDSGSPLTIGVAPSTQPGAPAEKPAGELKGFAIAGEDHKWVWANARIDGDTVVVWNDALTRPVAVRYAWANNPACNLYNRAGLPASPFRTDDFAMVASKPKAKP